MTDVRSCNVGTDDASNRAKWSKERIFVIPPPYVNVTPQIRNLLVWDTQRIEKKNKRYDFIVKTS